jgi:hypothetical protein
VRFKKEMMRSALISVVAGLGLVAANAQTFQLVNMVPVASSNETCQDSEPNVAVNLLNPLQIAGSAFTPDPGGSGNSPLYVSSDGGHTWTLVVNLPGSNIYTNATGDVTMRFGRASNVIYAGILNGSTGNLNILRTNNYLANALMTTLVDRSGVDQPYVEATTSGSDRVYIGNNNNLPVGPKTATVDVSQDAATAAPPANFVNPPDLIETRTDATTPGGKQDGPSVRPAINLDGTIYVAYFGWRTFSPTTTTDIVVTRDDNWGTGASPFTALLDLNDGLAGQRINGTTTVTVPWYDYLGTERIGSQLSIAVDPLNSSTVFVAWQDGASAATSTIHVRRSTDKGQHWSGDLLAISQATNPALAINAYSLVGFVYQRLVNPGTCHGSGGAGCWETHFRSTTDGTTWSDTVLGNVPDIQGATCTVSFDPSIGDYIHLQAIGKDFYGVFSGYNYPDTANFYPGVQYQRYADFGAHKLYADAAHTVQVTQLSIDPFFFHVSEPDPTTLKYQGDTSADYHDPAKLAAILTNQVNGQPIPNASVQFTLGTQSCSATTNAAGLASCSLVLEQCAGSYTVKADFAGSAGYLPSSDSKPFTVNLEEATLSYTGDTVIANGGTATLSGVLLEDNTTPITGRTVTFTLGTGAGAQTCSAVTNGSGIAVCSISPVAQPLGPGVVADTFAGDACYRPASASANTFLFAFLTSGAFAVGDQSAQMGAKVTFWGAKWSQDNNLSGGPAPASFKGFASTLSVEPPKCGLTWTTGPGASSNPPASVPAYMGVLASTKVTKSGPTISGEAKSIVVVKTDPGYAPNPGHAGTGTVVAVFCHP